MCTHTYVYPLTPTRKKEKRKKEKPTPVPEAPSSILELFIYTWGTPLMILRYLRMGHLSYIVIPKVSLLYSFTHSFEPISVCHE